MAAVPPSDADPDFEILVDLVREADAATYPLAARPLLHGFLAGTRDELPFTEERLRADPELLRLAAGLVKWAPLFARIVTTMGSLYTPLSPDAHVRLLHATIYALEVGLHEEVDMHTIAAIFYGKIDLETALRDRDIERAAGIAPRSSPPPEPDHSRLGGLEPPKAPDDDGLGGPEPAKVRPPNMDHVVAGHIVVPVPPDSIPVGRYPNYGGHSPTASFLAPGERSDLYALYKHWAEQGGWRIELDGPGLLKVSKGETFVEITIGDVKLGRTPLKIRFAGTRSAAFEPRG